MINDPIVNKVRKIRHEIEQEYQGDSQKYYQHIQTIQENFVDRIVCRRPKHLINDKEKNIG